MLTDVIAPFLPIATTSPSTSFTTSPHLHALHPIIPLILLSPISQSDKALGIHRASKQLTHNVVHPPSPSTSRDDEAFPPPNDAWEAFYPAGSINPSGVIKGGFGFYMKGPKEFEKALKRVDAEDEVVCGYEVMFEDGFEWVKGGKLPGVYGGVGDLAYGCTGGRKEQRCSCFDLRLMWRSDGRGELYTYLPLNDVNRRALLSVPDSIENSDYGFSVGRGVWKFVSGRWYAVAIRVKMNHVGEEDGEIDVYVNGKTIISVRGLIFREGPEAAKSRVQGMHFQTFFGGSKPDWASPKDQRTWFASASGAVLSSAHATSQHHDEL